MIIEFSVSNFRSIREEQRLSFVASNYDDSLPENLIELNVPGLEGMKLLKGLVLFGANASGKSNLIHALEWMVITIINPATLLTGQVFPLEPFLLDKESPNSPSKFELIFVKDNIRYDYGFVIDRKRVYEEYLYFYPKKKKAKWFHRKFDDGKYKYEYGKGMSRDKNMEEFTLPNSLYLSSVNKKNNDDLRPLYEWLTRKVLPSYPFLKLFSGVKIEGSTIEVFDENYSEMEIFIAMMKQADFNVVGYLLTPRNVLNPDGSSVDENNRPQRYNVFLQHKKVGSDGTVPLRLETESTGTQSFYYLLGPLITAQRNNGVLLIDESDHSLHPLLVRQLLGKFLTESNRSAQFLMASHDTTLMDTNFLRRDQIYLTEKTDEGVTQIYSMSDFKVRTNEALQKGYLTGRYGAIPSLGE